MVFRSHHHFLRLLENVGLNLLVIFDKADWFLLKAMQGNSSLQKDHRVRIFLEPALHEIDNSSLI